MSIELHCPNCSRMIRAPEDAGGKHGKCPYCGQSVYIPMPRATIDEEIGLAPIDEEDELRAEELRRESIRYAASVDHDAPTRSEGAAPRGTMSRPVETSSSPGEVIEIGPMVERFVLAMRDSKLDEAEKIATRLRKAGTRARDYVENLLLDQMAPRIKDVPAALTQGFLKNLLERLN